MGIYGKNAVPQIAPRTRTHTLCESAQSKCTSTLQKSHVIRKFAGKRPCPFRRDIRRATLHGNLGKNAVPQNRGAHFVRACAVEMHFNISQEPLHTEIYRKNAAHQSEPRTRTPTLGEPAQSKRMSRFHKSHFLHLQEKGPCPE